MSLNYLDKVVKLFKYSQHNQFHIKITFFVIISKAENETFNLETLSYLLSPVFPMAICIWHFLESVRLTELLFANTEGHQQPTENDVIHCISRNASKF